MPKNATAKIRFHEYDDPPTQDEGTYFCLECYESHDEEHPLHLLHIKYQDSVGNRAGRRMS